MVRWRPRLLEPSELTENAPDGVHVLIAFGFSFGNATASYEVWELDGGSRALLCYSAVQVLHAACGEGQPSRWMAAGQLARHCAVSDVDVVLLDEPLPVPPRYPQPDVSDQADLPELTAQENVGDLLYLPSRPARRGDARVDIELQPHRGKRTLLAFTSAQALRDGCGEFQPWVSVQAVELPEIVAETGAERVVFNPTLAEQSRHTAPALRSGAKWRT